MAPARSRYVLETSWRPFEGSPLRRFGRERDDRLRADHPEGE